MTDHLSSEEFIHLAVEASPSGMIMTEASGEIVLVNAEVERMFGYRREELLGESIDILVPTKVREVHGEHRAIFNESPEARRIGIGRDLFGLRKDGSEVPVEIGLNSIRTRRGWMNLSTITDISERKLADERFRLVVEACPSGMIMTDPAGTIVLVNLETERLFGYRREDLIGRSIEMLVPSRIRNEHAHFRDAFAARPETRSMGAGRDLHIVCKDGAEVPVEIGLTPVRTREGMMVLSAIVDISERRRIQKLKDEFVSTVSHELRTPLTSITGSLGLLVGNAAGKSPDAVMRLLSIAHKNSQRLGRLLNDILDIEKLESGRVVFVMARVDARPLVEQAIEDSRPYAESLGVTIRIDASSADSELHADPDRFVQVITNLLSNAIKFSPSGEEIVVSIMRADDNIRIAVRDHGPGIPADFRARIYDKFAQADSTDSRLRGGTGLGLSIVKSIVTRFGGTIGFSDAPGGGTIFHVELPAWQNGVGAAQVLQ